MQTAWTERLLGGFGAARGKPRSGAGRAPLVTSTDLLLACYLFVLRYLSAFATRDLLYRIGALAAPFLQFRSRKWKREAIGRMTAAAGCGVTVEKAPYVASRLVSNGVFAALDDLVLARPSFRQALRCSGLSGIEHLDRARSTGKGVLVLTGHFYALRVARRHLATLGYPMLTVRSREVPDSQAGRLGRRLLQSQLAELRGQTNQDAVYVQDPDCTLKILKRLRSGGMVNILFDSCYGARTVEGSLFGAPYCLSVGLFDIIRLSGCAVVPMLSFGRSTGFHIAFSPMLVLVKAPTRDEFVSANLHCLEHVLETQIAAHPEEWTLWIRP